MAKIYLEKAGLVRCEAEDFSDDGTRFKCYRLDGELVSYAKKDGYVYLSLTFKEINQCLNHYDKDYFKLCSDADSRADEFNGVNENLLTKEALDLWVEDMKYWISKIRNTQEPKYKVYYNTVDDNYYAMACRWNGYSGRYITNSLEVVPKSYISRFSNQFDIKKLVIVDMD